MEGTILSSSLDDSSAILDMGNIPFPKYMNDETSSHAQEASDSDYDDTIKILRSFIPAYLVDKLENKFATRARLDAAEAEIERLSLVLNDLTRQSASNSAETGIIALEGEQTAQQRTEYFSKIQNENASHNILTNAKIENQNYKTDASQLASCEWFLLKTADIIQPEVSVLFADVVGFTALSAQMDASRVARMLRRLFTRFDALATAHGVQPLDVIGDAYLAVTNLDGQQPADHAARIARFAVAAIAAARTIPVDPSAHDGGVHLTIRVGLHCGPVALARVSAVSSKQSLIGDTVNTASRMESTSRPNRTQCSAAMAALLAAQAPELSLRKRDSAIEVKGKGRMETFWVGPHPVEVAGRGGPGGSFRFKVANEGRRQPERGSFCVRAAAGSAQDLGSLLDKDSDGTCSEGGSFLGGSFVASEGGSFLGGSFAHNYGSPLSAEFLGSDCDSIFDGDGRGSADADGSSPTGLGCCRSPSETAALRARWFARAAAAVERSESL